MDAFYQPDGHAFLATELTRGPWSDDAQHGGPPLALLGREIERAAGAGFVARFTAELLRSLPFGRYEVSAEVVRPGKRSQSVHATLALDGVPCARATALVLSEAPVELPARLPRPVLPRPDASQPYTFTFFRAPVGYHTAMELRVARGVWGSGAMAGWLRMRVPLVAGEEPSPLQRVLVAADAGNGVSAPLPLDQYLFINPDLTLHLHRRLRGPWVGLDGLTRVEPNGVGLAQAEVFDADGPVGRSLQSLLVSRRP
ncbi:MAG: thioesterase family protein [Deltaproteobacteria bacterium]|nr:thioesterase family protein [Deltaproteobacteria bacterium]